MRTATLLGLLLLFSGGVLSGRIPDAQSEQSTLLKSCPVLTVPEAAAVLGPGTIFGSGVEATAGKVRLSLLCEFLNGERTLKVQATKTAGDRNAWEALRKLSNGTPEPALGEYAYSDVDEGKPGFFIVKGPLTLELRIGGPGGSAADLAKLRDAAKKAVSRL
jgi:hypothetical protein